MSNLKLLAGLPIEFENGLLYSPKLKEIAKIGEEKYSEYLWYMFFDKGNLEGIEALESMTDFEALFAISYYDQKFKDELFSAFQFFLKEVPEHRHTEDSVFFYFPLSKWRLDKDNFPKFQECIELINNVKKPIKDEYKPANARAKRLMEKLSQFPVPKKRNEITLFSIVNALAWRNNGINIKEIFDLTIYQLYQAFFTTENIDHYLFTLQGIYAGTVDSKKINLSKIHWAKEYKSL